MGSKQESMTNASAPDSKMLIDCIYQIGRMFENITQPEKLLLTIMEECRKLMHCEAASIALVEDDNQLRFVVAKGGDDVGIRDWRVPFGEGIVGLVAQSGEPLLSNDPQNDPRWYGQVNKGSSFVTRNLAAVPFRKEGRVIGVLEALNRAHDAFSPADLRLLQLFADQVAVAINMQRLMDAKEQSDRQAGFAVALADISHTVKNILTRMKIPQTVIEMGCAQGNLDMVNQAWGVMKTATGEINNLVLDMLSFSKPVEPRIEPTDVFELVHAVLNTCGNDSTDKGIELRLEPQGDASAWPMDASMVRPAILNLVGNAIEAIHEHKPGSGVITIGIEAGEDVLQITVRDNGPGIPAHIIPKLFTPFFSHGKKSGTGLGLANVRKCIEEHGGAVKLESTEGQGTTFILSFPRNRLQVGRD